MKLPTGKRMVDTMQAGYFVSQTDVLRTYDAAACRLYKFTEAPLEGFAMSEYGAFVDVYEGLEVFGNDPTSVDAVGLGIVTTGWAARLDGEEIPASQHPSRVRVILYHACNVAGDQWGLIYMKGNWRFSLARRSRSDHGSLQTHSLEKGQPVGRGSLRRCR